MTSMSLKATKKEIAAIKEMLPPKATPEDVEMALFISKMAPEDIIAISQIFTRIENSEHGVK
jgi:hypothetical protein